MRAIFFGSPPFAVPCLEVLAEIADVVLVVSQPDRPSGRGMKLRPPAVKARALELGLEVHQPTKVRTNEFAELLRSQRADIGVVVAYGRILPLRVLEAPRLGCVNVHASLLPRWRGAAPVQWAIVEGDAETGVALMQMDEGMDTGPVLALRRTAIGANETYGGLLDRLSTVGAALLRDELARYIEGALVATPQPIEGVTMARMLTKDDGRLRWQDDAQRVHDRVRGLSPWPGTFTHVLDGEPRRIKVHRTRVVAREGTHGKPGTVLQGTDAGIEVACGRGVIAIDELQDPGKKRLDAVRYLAGRGMNNGTRLGEAS